MLQREESLFNYPPGLERESPPGAGCGWVYGDCTTAWGQLEWKEFVFSRASGLAWNLPTGIRGLREIMGIGTNCRAEWRRTSSYWQDGHFEMPLQVILREAIPHCNFQHFPTSSSTKFKGSPLHSTKIFLQPSQWTIDNYNVIKTNKCTAHIQGVGSFLFRLPLGTTINHWNYRQEPRTMVRFSLTM